MATAPSLKDRIVPVTAYMTDEMFGHDYWAARQFCAPRDSLSRRWAVLIICDTLGERDVWVDALKQDRLPVR